MSDNPKYLGIILAAGKGKRLDFNGPKPLFNVFGQCMIDYLIDSFIKIESVDLLTVVGYQKEKVINHIKVRSSYILQNRQLGTGHAAIQCVEDIKKYDNVFIVAGDAPFISSRYLMDMINGHSKENADCTFLFSKFPIKLPYGRLLFNKDGKLKELVEDHQTNSITKKQQNYFTSQYLFKSRTLIKLLNRINPDPDTGEYNLTDSINLLIKDNGKLLPIFIKNYWELMGINSLDDLSFIRSLDEHK